MPELPDLEVFSRNLSKALKSKRLENIGIANAGKARVSEKELNEVLVGKKLRDVTRVGKQLCFDFGKDARLFMHLMLHGRLVIQRSDADPPKHTLASLNFGAEALYLTDYQKAAHLLLNPEAGDAVDALSEELDGDWLAEKFSGSRAKVKTLLMDQKVIAGIGNAYADEILWEAKIDPESVAGKIPANVVNALSKAIGKVLRDAEKKILKENPDIISGEVRDFLKIHNSKKEKSPGGAAILSKSVGGRKTYFTEEQKRYQ
ncbi:DNA-formamidopyrimidine glycosylase family protein [Dyadobacter sp. 676]|uniref:DNA-formamidopyrimidine glycosylase family protein n=1 Tax=Dyadobacter sp. 676 TaxID=3088362 RepID=A0AAU8FFG0_9BACT